MGIQVSPFTLFQEKKVETRIRGLRYDLNAMADFEQTTGMGLPRLMATQAIFATSRALLWAGLKHQDRGLTIDLVGIKIQAYLTAGGEIDDLLKVCVKACVDQKAVPGLKMMDEEDTGEPPVPNVTGSESSLPTGIPIAPGPVTSE